MGKRYKQDKRGFGPGMMAYFVKAAMIDRDIPAYLDDAGARARRRGRRGRRRARRAGREGLLRAREEGRRPRGRRLRLEPRAARGTSSTCPSGSRWCSRASTGDAMMMGAEIGAADRGRARAATSASSSATSVPGEEHDGQAALARLVGGRLPARHLGEPRRASASPTSRSTATTCRRRARGTASTQTQPELPAVPRLRRELPREVPARHLPARCRTSRRRWSRRADTLARARRRSSASTATGSRRTVARFNRFAAEGVDRDFGRGTYPWAAMMTGDRTRPNPNLGPLDKPPFYGLRLRVASVGINAAGLRTNADAQVMHVRGRAHPGPLRGRQLARRRSTSAPATRAACPTCAAWSSATSRRSTRRSGPEGSRSGDGLVQEEEAWDLETDVLVIGTGGAGLTAALAAHDAAREVMLLEKTRKVGGTTAVSGGVLWVPEQPPHGRGRHRRLARRGARATRSASPTGAATTRLIERFLDTAPAMIRVRRGSDAAALQGPRPLPRLPPRVPRRQAGRALARPGPLRHQRARRVEEEAAPQRPSSA